MMINTVQIDNNPDLVRDMASKAIISTDAIGLGRYKEQRRKSLAQKQEVEETKQRLVSIEREMDSLKKIVHELSTMRSKS
jgi:hypothetical protein